MNYYFLFIDLVVEVVEDFGCAGDISLGVNWFIANFGNKIH